MPLLGALAWSDMQMVALYKRCISQAYQVKTQIWIYSNKHRLKSAEKLGYYCYTHTKKGPTSSLSYPVIVLLYTTRHVTVPFFSYKLKTTLEITLSLFDFCSQLRYFFSFLARKNFINGSLEWHFHINHENLHGKKSQHDLLTLSSPFFLRDKLNISDTILWELIVARGKMYGTNEDRWSDQKKIMYIFQFKS